MGSVCTLSVNVFGPTDAPWQCVWCATGEVSYSYCSAVTCVFLAASGHGDCGKSFTSVNIALPVYFFTGRRTGRLSAYIEVPLISKPRC